jgi:hypothetical protein
MAWAQVGIVGHSFVRRLADFIGEEGSRFSNLGLRNCDVRFWGRGGWKVGDVALCMQDLIDFCPQVVILLLGDNDLAPVLDPEEIATHIVAMASFIKAKTGAGRIIIGQLMPRFWHHTHRFLFPGYNTLACEVNKTNCCHGFSDTWHTCLVS